MFEEGLTLGDVLELSADELRDELAGRDIDTNGMSKVEMQKALIEILFPVVPVAPVVAQPVSALSPQQLMELEVMKLKMESEEREQGRQALEMKETFEREEKAVERKKEAESLARKEASEKEEKAIERQEKAEA